MDELDITPSMGDAKYIQITKLIGTKEMIVGHFCTCSSFLVNLSNIDIIGR